jgi:hypothetical protein
MNKNIIVIIAVTVILIVGGAYLLTRPASKPNNPTGYELFWGEGCTHCQNVETFLTSWDKKDQIQISKLEVFNNKANGNKLIEWGQTCNLPKEQLGSVPLLVTPDGKCYSGDTPIIDFLKSI